MVSIHLYWFETYTVSITPKSSKGMPPKLYNLLWTDFTTLLNQGNTARNVSCLTSNIHRRKHIANVPKYSVQWNEAKQHVLSVVRHLRVWYYDSGYCAWNMHWQLLLISASDFVPHSGRGRIVFGLLRFAVIVNLASYSGTVTSFLAVSVTRLPYSTLNQVITESVWTKGHFTLTYSKYVT